MCVEGQTLENKRHFTFDTQMLKVCSVECEGKSTVKLKALFFKVTAIYAVNLE